MTDLHVEELVREVESRQPAATSPLTYLSTAVLVSRHLAGVGDELIDHYVQRARSAGLSWTDIGQCMGVSKQAAQKRFVAERPPVDDDQRFVEDFEAVALRALGLADEEARLLGHRYIGTEHLLLGLLREPGTRAFETLSGAGVTLEEARSVAEGIVGAGEGSPTGRIPMTPRTRKVLEISLREARDLGVQHPHTEHVLLGIIREGKGVGAQILGRLAGDLDALRTELSRG